MANALPLNIYDIGDGSQRSAYFFSFEPVPVHFCMLFYTCYSVFQVSLAVHHQVYKLIPYGTL